MGTVTATDQDSADTTISFTITSGADKDLFTITDGALSFNSAPDFETPLGGANDDANAYKITVTATSGTGDRLMTAIQDLTVSVTDVDEQPEVTGDGDISHAENNEADVATYSVTDPVAGTDHTWTVEGTDAAAFTIGTTGVLSFVQAPDFESKSMYSVTVKATDTSNSTRFGTLDVIVTVTDENEVPAFTSGSTFSVAENTTAVATVTATDQDSADTTVTLAITAGADKDLFSITNDGTLSFTTAPDFENPLGGANDDSNSYNITVEATSGTGARLMTATQNLTITVSDDNDAPAFTSGSTFSVAENTTAVATVTATDQDSADTTVTFAITAGADKDLFSITNDGTLSFTTAPDFENPLGGANDDSNSYNITVEATSGTGIRSLSATQDITITVTDVPLFNRQVRTWTGRNADNTADVTLVTYGTWATDSNPPEDAPDITKSDPTIETRPDVDEMVRKKITWTDNSGNYAYQFTEWYAPTRTEYREVKHWSDDLGKTTGLWGSNPNPSGAPNVGNRNSAQYRDNAGAGGTWVWEGRAVVHWYNPQLPIEITIYGQWVDRGGSHPDNDPPAAGTPGSSPSHEPSSTRQVETRPAAPADYEYVPANGPTESPADIGAQEFEPTGYRQVRTWAGRNADNTADVTLVTFGTWTTDSNPPEDAPDITKSDPTIETRPDVDEMVRKKITWTDNNGNYAYQFTEWYALTRTEYREVKHWSDGLGRTTGPWGSNPNPSGAPGLDTRGGTDYRDNAGAGGTWTWEGRNHRDWWNPQTSASTRIYGPWVDRGGTHPDNDPPAAGAPGSSPSHEPSSSRQVETREIALPTDYEYMPANGPTENPARIGIRGPQLL